MDEQLAQCLINSIRQQIRLIRQHLLAMDWRQSDNAAKIMATQMNRLRREMSKPASPSGITLASLVSLERDVRNITGFMHQKLAEQQQAILKTEQHQRALYWLNNDILA